MAIVGKDTVFTIFDDEKVKPYLDAIEGDSRTPAAGVDMVGTMAEPALGEDQGRPPRQGDPEFNVDIESMEH